ncbi:hypothetical protein LPJ57_001378 [Coemansia sp. RSA 486]|nr:hypothetical protein LPJ57_001378 [Coemansia sp. RSA 486]KAJ2237989.1 hypothetical protein IWW45_000464 [Coemansia sp. RSA 485]
MTGHCWSAVLFCALVGWLLAQTAEARLRVDTRTHRRAYTPSTLYNQRLTSNDVSTRCTSTAITNTDLHNPPPMRLKQPSLCDPQVRQYSGYLDLDSDSHVFFWYFGSRQRLEPGFNATQKTIPLVFWFSGGPGCSSQIANWQENGPCLYMPDEEFDKSMDDEERKKLPHSVKRNQWAWNQVADVVYVDQPVGTGFSYGQMPNSTEAAADTAWLAMQAIYAKLSQDAKDKGEAPLGRVTLMGESYAGRYIPVFTEYLLQMNKHVAKSADLKSRGYLELPLNGIGIGNGLFDYRIQSPTYYTMGCKSTYPALFSRHQCSYLKNTVNPQCEQKMKSCYDGMESNSSALGMRQDRCVSLVREPWRTSKECTEADRYCGGALGWTTMISTYDVRPNARLVPDDYVSYLRTREFTDAVGVSDIEYEECSDAVFDNFSSTNDEVSRSAMASLEYILDSNVPVLLYSGDADLICNWYGNLAVAKALQWKGSEKFAQAETVAWSWPAKSGNRIEAGQLMSAGNLQFLRVYEAGHEVPYYQPQASLYMLAQFLSKQRVAAD